MYVLVTKKKYSPIRGEDYIWSYLVQFSTKTSCPPPFSYLGILFIYVYNPLPYRDVTQFLLSQPWYLNMQKEKQNTSFYSYQSCDQKKNKRFSLHENCWKSVTRNMLDKCWHIEHNRIETGWRKKRNWKQGGQPLKHDVQHHSNMKNSRTEKWWKTVKETW